MAPAQPSFCVESTAGKTIIDTSIDFLTDVKNIPVFTGKIPVLKHTFNKIEHLNIGILGNYSENLPSLEEFVPKADRMKCGFCNEK